MATAAVACETKDLATPTKAPSLSSLTIGALIAAAHLPLLMAHARQLWVRPHYQFFPIVLVGAVLLLFARRSEIQARQPGRAAIGAGIGIFAWLLLAGAELIYSPWLGAVATLVLVLAVIYSIGGGLLVRQLLPVWFYLWLLIPLPFGLDNALVLSLQTLTTRWSSALLDLAGVHHVIAGHVLEVAGQRLFVEDACAGINSLFSMLACALFYVFFKRIPPVRATVLLLASVAWVLLANVARVFLIAYLFKRWDIDWTSGWHHDALGFVVFAFALGLTWSTNCLILFLTPFAKRTAESAQSAATEHSLIDAETSKPAAGLAQTWLNSWLAGASYGLLLVGHLLVYGPALASSDSPGNLTAGAAQLTEESLPIELLGWRRERMTEETRSANNAYGQYSKIWHYQGELQRAAVSLDFPFANWHDLNECYYGQGWELDQTINRSGLGSGPAHYCEVNLKKSGLRWGYLVYCQFDAAGHVLTPPPRGSIAAALQRHESALTRLLAWNAHSSATAQPIGAVYQCQLLVETYAPLSQQDRSQITQRFFHAYQKLSRQITSSSN
jgi:exosortase